MEHVDVCHPYIESNQSAVVVGCRTNLKDVREYRLVKFLPVKRSVLLSAIKESSWFQMDIC